MASQINLGKYAKTITAVIGAGVAIGAKYLGADGIVADVVLVLTALGVYTVPNSEG